MALSGQSLGGEFLIYVDGTAIGYCKSGTLNWTRDMIPATSKSSTNSFDGNKPGGQRWDISFDALYIYAATYGLSDLYTLGKAGTQFSVKFSPNTSGNKYFTGNMYVDSLTLDTPDKENSTYSGSFTGDGDLDEVSLT